MSDIEDALSLAAKDNDKLDDAVTFAANLVVAYDTLQDMNDEMGNEFGVLVYGLVRDEVHALFHLLLAAKAQRDEENEEDAE